MNGIELIAKERQEQIEKHGRTIEKDVAENPYGELSQGAVALLTTSPKESGKNNHIGDFPAIWDADICQKMADKPYKERLIIAGALIAAEIDRLNAQQ